MLDEFLAWQVGPEVSCEEELWFRIADARQQGDRCVIRLEAEEQYAPNRSSWRIEAEDVLEVSLRLDDGSTAADLHTDHPLLIPHTTPHTELFVRDAPRDPAALLGDLLMAHKAIDGGWLRPDAFLHAGYGPLLGDRSRGMGVLAEGPRPFLDAYAEVARGHGMGPSLVGDRLPARWRDGAWVPHPSPLYALVLADSWIVAERFACERLPVEPTPPPS